MAPAPFLRTPSQMDSARFGGGVRENLLRDPRYPVHRIADKLLPYLRVLIEQFHPYQVILFGSYAYGEPDEHSDVDLLVVKEIKQSRLRDAVEIQRAWFPLLLSGPRLDIQLLLESLDHRSSRPVLRSSTAEGGGNEAQISLFSDSIRGKDQSLLTSAATFQIGSNADISPSQR